MVEAFSRRLNFLAKAQVRRRYSLLTKNILSPAVALEKETISGLKRAGARVMFGEG